MKKFFHVLKFIAVPLLVGYISMLLQHDSLENWYPSLLKSSLTPSGIVFSVVWTVLYVLMGVSAAIVWSKPVPGSWMLELLYSLQLFLNLLWTFCFFFLRLPLPAFIVIVLLFLVVALFVAGCYRNHRVAAFLNFPYLLWLLFAAYLNGYVMICN